MKNSTQLKAYVKNIAKEKNISPQLVLQNYILERFLERLSISEYRKNYIIKGGFLIAAMIGISNRTTMDIDMTVKRKAVNKENILNMIGNIGSIEIEDNIIFEVKNIEEIREQDMYSGYRVYLLANYPPMKIPLKLDITTGDKITPKEIEYTYNLMFENRSIKILAYNISTILAEKLETILARGNQNTRLRDFYDVYILECLQKK